MFVLYAPTDCNFFYLRNIFKLSVKLDDVNKQLCFVLHQNLLAMSFSYSKVKNKMFEW